MSFGEKLHYLRENKGLTQAELGQELGVTEKAVSKWERGDTKPDIEMLPQLADFFNINIDDLFDRTHNHCEDMLESAFQYFKSLPKEQALEKMQEMVSYMILGADVSLDEERKYYKPEIMKQLIGEWRELIENKDDRPQIYADYMNRNGETEMIWNLDNDLLKFCILQRFNDGSFEKVLEKWNVYQGLFEVLSMPETGKYLQFLYSDSFAEHKTEYFTAEYAAEQTGISADKVAEISDALYKIFRKNLLPGCIAEIEGKDVALLTPVKHINLQAVIAAAYAACENWGGER